MQCSNLNNTPQDGCLGAGPYAQVVYGVDGNCDDYADCVNRGYTNVDIGWDGVSPPIEIPDLTRVGLITRTFWPMTRSGATDSTWFTHARDAAL